ncbi:MAG: preprotein translocase subunit SecG, partial [Phycisphaeraceae bacterium]|nr:preprotein translocase subunit SecG [Phycisphaeraceae bacterium]
MSTWIVVLTMLFIVVSAALVLIILVQRPQGGGLAGAFGGAGGSGADTAFGGRTGDALTVATVAGFVIYIVLAVALNIMDNPAVATTTEPTPPASTAPATP